MKIIKSSTAGSGAEKSEFIFEDVKKPLIQPRTSTITIEADNLLMDDDIDPIVMPGVKKEITETFPEQRKCNCKFISGGGFE